MTRQTPVRRAATYDDLLAVPDHLVAEILAGDLYTSPRPSPRHAVASSGLGADLGGPFDRGRGGPGGWWILAEPELHLGDDVVVPDLAGWRRTRLPEMPAEAFFTLAPDWVCETLSPATERIDRGKKLAIYAREGVAHTWLVNPIAETLEAYRLERERWVLLVTHTGDVAARIEPFDAVELELWRLWGRSEPRATP
jgi:Uma2 family endonuclease